MKLAHVRSGWVSCDTPDLIMHYDFERFKIWVGLVITCSKWVLSMRRNGIIVSD